MIAGARMWCGRCGEDLDGPRQKCACAIGIAIRSPTSCEPARAARIIAAMLHLGIPESEAKRSAVECVHRVAS